MFSTVQLRFKEGSLDSRKAKLKGRAGMKTAYRVLFAGMLAIVFCGTAVADARTAPQKQDATTYSAPCR